MHEPFVYCWTRSHAVAHAKITIFQRLPSWALTFLRGAFQEKSFYTPQSTYSTIYLIPLCILFFLFPKDFSISPMGERNQIPLRMASRKVQTRMTSDCNCDNHEFKSSNSKPMNNSISFRWKTADEARVQQLSWTDILALISYPYF